ncbi:unnamed protein product [Clonostachys rhizophaga]|uniref:F-box domain-containing protein n=1 Tax=Clonostachys rhizophaga TaxID=160324 RepID=A0A9N9YTS8_9HYPO|nr:unnamed protein product [Clonostachys rhizophaga]
MARLLLLDLPAEILHLIASKLPNSGIKNLRLTCSFAQVVFRLRFDRVFLSPHQRDIDVFCQVACSETFRHQVVELVWDQNQFCPGEVEWEDFQFDAFTVLESYELATEMVRFQRNRIAKVGCLRSDDFTPFGGINMPVSRIAKIHTYVQIRRETNEERNNDSFALEHHINRFPSLKRITISHSTNGWLFEPYYETPQIRSFPSGFMYDIERSDPPIEPLWNGFGRIDPSEYAESTRAYGAIFRALAGAKELQLEEIVMENPNGVNYGLPIAFFTQPLALDYLNLVELLRRPHLRRFDLVVTKWGEIPDNGLGPHPPATLLNAALGKATSLTHFSFKLTTFYHHPANNWFPLKTLLPINRWTNLRHFELAHLAVRQNDLANLLGGLPQSIRSIELGFLEFFEESESLAGLLDEIHERAFWSGRDEMNRPRLGISLSVGQCASRSIAIRVDAEIETFLYKQGMNPFRGSQQPDDVESGKGTERDVFNPEYEWPRDEDFDWQVEIDRAEKRLSRMLMISEGNLRRIEDAVSTMEVDVEAMRFEENSHGW